MFQNRIFNVLEKANNNIKLTIVEHLVFSQIQRIQKSQREKKFEKKEPTKDENDTKTAPKRNKNKPISLTETKNHRRKKSPQRTKNNNSASSTEEIY